MVKLTPTGGVFLVIALVILVRSLLGSNVYEIILSSASLLLLLFLGVVGVWKSKKQKHMEPGWITPFPMTAVSAEESIITGLKFPMPFFFRLHFVVRGKFSPAVGVNFPVRIETSLARGEDTAKLTFNFPISGVFHGKGQLRLADIFGFFSFPCGVEQNKSVNVRSSPFFGNKIFINAQTGAEDKRTKQSSDEERYYMRQYTAGDRLRDINWKSSEKIDMLITRISPENQEKVSRIEVYFRNYGPCGAHSPSLEALWLLDRAKSRLAHFLRSILEEHSSFIFDVRSANAEWRIENTNHLDEFIEELASVSFAAPQNESLDASKSELYVFTTACDTGLPGFLMGCSPRPISLFITQPAETTGFETTELEAEKSEPQVLYRTDFLKNGIILKPGMFLRKPIAKIYAAASRVETISTETRL